MTKQSKSFYTVRQVADKLQLHWQTVLDYIRIGKLEAMKLGKGYRIPTESLEKFIQESMADAKLSSIASSERFASLPPRSKYDRHRSILIVPVGIRKNLIAFDPKSDKVVQEIVRSNTNMLDPKPDVDGLVDDRTLEYDGREIYFRITNEGIIFLRCSLVEPENQVFIGRLLSTTFHALKIAHDVYEKFDIDSKVFIKFRMEAVKDNVLRTGSESRGLSIEDKSLNERIEVNSGPVALETEKIVDLTVIIVLQILRGFGNNRLATKTLKDFLEKIMGGKE